MALHCLASYEDALVHMRSRLEGLPGAIPRPHVPQLDDDNDEKQGGKKRKNRKLEQLITFANFEQHDDIVTYLTGLCNGERDWLFPKLEKAV